MKLLFKKINNNTLISEISEMTEIILFCLNLYCFLMALSVFFISFNGILCGKYAFSFY